MRHVIHEKKIINSKYVNNIKIKRELESPKNPYSHHQSIACGQEMVPLYYYLNTKVSEGGLHKMGKMHKYPLSYGVVSNVYLELFSLPSFKSFIFLIFIL